MTTTKPLKPKPESKPGSILESLSRPHVPKDLGPLPEKKPPTLTFSDGLNFGCGFWVAGFLFTIIALPISTIILSIIIGLLGGLGR